MKQRLAWSPVLLLTASTVEAQVYDVGPNIVNMAGSRCRSHAKSSENNLYHEFGATTVKSAVALERLYCPIARRGTSIYGGMRHDGTFPSKPNDTPDKVNIISIMVSGSDFSSANRFSCFAFGARRTDQTLYFGATKALCGSQFGCNPNDVSSAWTGSNTMGLSAPSNFNTVQTANFGVTCDVPSSSTIQFIESAITPN